MWAAEVTEEFFLRNHLDGVLLIENTVVLLIKLQGNRCGTGKSRQNSKGTGIAKFAGAACPKTVQLTVNTGVAPVKGVSPAKVMSPWS